MTGRVEADGSTRLDFSGPDHFSASATGTLTLANGRLNSSIVFRKADDPFPVNGTLALNRSGGQSAAPQGTAAPIGPFAAPSPASGALPAPATSATPLPARFAGTWRGDLVADGELSSLTLEVEPDGSARATAFDSKLRAGPSAHGRVEADGRTRLIFDDHGHFMIVIGKFDIDGDQIFIVGKVTDENDHHGSLGMDLVRDREPGTLPVLTPFAGEWSGSAETMVDLSKRDMHITVNPNGGFEGRIGGVEPGGGFRVAGWIAPNGHAFVDMGQNRSRGGDRTTVGDGTLDVNDDSLLGQITGLDDDEKPTSKLTIVLEKGG